MVVRYDASIPPSHGICGHCPHATAGRRRHTISFTAHSAPLRLFRPRVLPLAQWKTVAIRRLLLLNYVDFFRLSMTCITSPAQSSIFCFFF